MYPRSLHGGPGTRPASALTSGVSGFIDREGDGGDDMSEVDWNGSDLYSLASYKPSTAASYGAGRRVTSGELDHTTLINAGEVLGPEGPMGRWRWVGAEALILPSSVFPAYAQLGLMLRMPHFIEGDGAHLSAAGWPHRNHTLVFAEAPASPTA
jgi:hypothetical protein